MSDPLKTSDSARRDWPIDREIVLGRVIDAPRSLVYAAWTDPHQIQEWFGPAGMGIETREIDLKPGGVWRFDMVAPDGVRYGSRMVFLRMEARDCWRGLRSRGRWKKGGSIAHIFHLARRTGTRRQAGPLFG